MPDRESDAVAGKSGKWSQRGVPHKGWHCESVEDLEEPSETCEMCERVTIRYVHIMDHDDWFGAPLRCGCICAGHMEQDLAGARERETTMKRRASRRKKFPLRKGWTLTAKGNERLDYKGRRCVVYKVGESYRVMIVRPDGKAVTWQRKFRTPAEAKLAIFDKAEKKVAS